MNIQDFNGQLIVLWQWRWICNFNQQEESIIANILEKYIEILSLETPLQWVKGQWMPGNWSSQVGLYLHTNQQKVPAGFWIELMNQREKAKTVTISKKETTRKLSDREKIDDYWRTFYND